MKAILAERSLPVLRRYLRSAVLLAFDYDGTLAPIVADRTRAAMRSSTRALLRRAAERYPTIVISGRARTDVRRRLNGISLTLVVGNHGIEPWQVSQRRRRHVQRWVPVLAQRLGRLSGVELENKTYSLSIHYRRSRAKRQALQAIEKAAATLPGVRLVRGKGVVNLLPDDAPHKGIALKLALRRFRCDTAIYVGDDDTDEDVYALRPRGRILTIRVGKHSASRAEYFLPSQSQVDLLLRTILQIG